MHFKLNPTLEKDSIFIKNLELCQLRLINNSDFPWLILVPMQNNLVEITDLADSDYNQLNKEIKNTAKNFKDITKADKLNIATIGNVVPQLHIHIIARYKTDKLFPKPVWGYDFIPYAEDDMNIMITKLKMTT